MKASSRAAALEPHQSIEHVHRIFHFEGNKEALDIVARATLGVGLNALTAHIGKGY